MLSGGRTGDAKNRVEASCRAGFKEEWDYDDATGLPFRAPRFHLRKPAFPDFGMHDGFELFAPGFVRKDQAGEFIAAELAIRSEDRFAEDAPDFLQSRLSRLHDFAGQRVGVDDWEAARVEEIGGGRFSHADAA